MGLSAQVIDEEPALTALRRCAHVDGDIDLVRTALAAERIRVALAMPGAPATAVGLAARVRDAVAPIADAEFLRRASERGNRSFARNVLASLSLCGDIYEDEQVYKPSYTRLINVSPDDSVALIIGGAPTTIIESELSLDVRCIGIARVISRRQLSRADRSDGTKWQSLQDWLGIEERDLLGWTRRVIAEVLDSGIGGPPLGTESIEVLSVVNGRQRWSTLTTLRSVGGVTLCRGREPDRQDRWSYFLATLLRTEDGITVQRSKGVSENTARRLQFGIGLKASASVVFSAVRDGEFLLVKGLAMIPYPEKRILSLSRRIRPTGATVQYAFPGALELLLRTTLAHLGADLSIDEVTK